jgi:hypothetical protein
MDTFMKIECMFLFFGNKWSPELFRDKPDSTEVVTDVLSRLALCKWFGWIYHLFNTKCLSFSIFFIYKSDDAGGPIHELWMAKVKQHYSLHQDHPLMTASLLFC